MSTLSKIFLNLGLFFILIGIFLWVSPKIPGLRNLGRLPGDIILKNDHLQLYFPIVSSLLISLLLSFIFYLLTWFKK